MRPLFAAVLLLAVSGGCSRNAAKGNTATARSDALPASANPANPAADGRELFLANCTGCHGKNADGNTPSGKAWHVPNLRSPHVQALSDQQLLRIIRGGKGKMPAWRGLLSAADIDHLLAYVRSLGDKR